MMKFLANILGQRADTPVTDPASASASIASLIRGIMSKMPALSGTFLEPGYSLFRSSGLLTRPADINAYAIGDAITTTSGATNGIVEIANVARAVGRGAYIVAASLQTSDPSCVAQMDARFFNDPATVVPLDNAAFTYLSANDGKRNFSISFPAFSAPVGSQVARAETILAQPIPVACLANQSSLWYCLVTNSVFTPQSGQTFTLTLFLDRG